MKVNSFKDRIKPSRLGRFVKNAFASAAIVSTVLMGNLACDDSSKSGDKITNNESNNTSNNKSNNNTLYGNESFGNCLAYINNQDAIDYYTSNPFSTSCSDPLYNGNLEFHGQNFMLENNFPSSATSYDAATDIGYLNTVWLSDSEYLSLNGSDPLPCVSDMSSDATVYLKFGSNINSANMIGFIGGDSTATAEAVYHMGELIPMHVGQDLYINNDGNIYHFEICAVNGECNFEDQTNVVRTYFAMEDSNSVSCLPDMNAVDMDTTYDITDPFTGARIGGEHTHYKGNYKNNSPFVYVRAYLRVEIGGVYHINTYAAPLWRLPIEDDLVFDNLTLDSTQVVPFHVSYGAMLRDYVSKRTGDMLLIPSSVVNNPPPIIKSVPDFYVIGNPKLVQMGDTGNIGCEVTYNGHFGAVVTYDEYPSYSVDEINNNHVKITLNLPEVGPKSINLRYDEITSVVTNPDVVCAFGDINLTDPNYSKEFFRIRFYAHRYSNGDVLLAGGSLFHLVVQGNEYPMRDYMAAIESRVKSWEIYSAASYLEDPYGTIEFMRIPYLNFIKSSGPFTIRFFNSNYINEDWTGLGF